MVLVLRAASAADARILGAMNRQLADAERSRNPLTVDALAERMQKWLVEGWQGVLFETREFETPEVVGYSIFQIGKDYYEPAIPEVYIRQFFILETHRRQGHGRRAFSVLTTTQFPPGARIHLDVLATNPVGQRFWRSLGFEPYSLAMRLTPDGDDANSLGSGENAP